MSNPIDLCTTAQVRAWLSLNSGLQNSSQTSVVSTTIAVSISPGTQTVTPATVANMAVGMILGIDIGTAVAEYVSVQSVSPIANTFTAAFAFSHTGPGITVIDQTNDLVGRMITSASLYWLRVVGEVSGADAVPSSSPFVTPVVYGPEYYDGNGNNRIFLLHRPITAVSSLYINGVSVPQSTSFSTPGWVIDQSGKSLVLRTAGGFTSGIGYGYGPYYAQRFGPIYYFANGTQNIQVTYTAGYSGTPYDVNDAVTKLVGNYFKRRDWMGQKQAAQPQTIGTVTYQDWWVPPEVTETIRQYRSLAFNG